MRTRLHDRDEGESEEWFTARAEQSECFFGALNAPKHIIRLARDGERIFILKILRENFVRCMTAKRGRGLIHFK